MWMSLEDARQTYSDMHKDAYGFRDSFNESWELSDFNEEYERMAQAMEFEEEMRQRAEEWELAEHNTWIQVCIKHGAPDHQTAERWIKETDDYTEYWR